MPEWPVIRFESIDSTNSEAKRRAQSGDLGPAWLIAATQTAGRGRLDRSWISPPGNLFATALFEERGGFAVAMRLPFAAGLAVCDAVDAIAPHAAAKLKWPNDLRVGGAKLSGILVETGTFGDHFWVAAGIGINVAQAPAGAGQPAICLADLSLAHTPAAEDVFQSLCLHFERRLEQARSGFDILRRDWLSRAEALGQSIRVGQSDPPVEGVFEDLANDGALVLRLPDGSQRLIRAGDMIIPGGH